MSALAKMIALFLFGCVALSMFTTYLFSRPNNPLTFYDVLGLDSVQATNKEIKTHYRGMIRKLHPDHRRHYSEEELRSVDRFNLDQVNNAYNTLSNPHKRIRYDYTLSHAPHFHYQVHTQSQQDKVQRVYEYNPSWDTGVESQLFSSIDKVLLGYEIKYPQYKKLAREIYQSAPSNNNNADNSTEKLETIDIKPYILEKSISYDNVISYHFSDWQDQLDKPRQNLINAGMIVFSLVSAIAPLWFMCAPSKPQDNNDGNDDGEEEIIFDENGEPILVKRGKKEHEKAGWSKDDVERYQKTLKQRRQQDDVNNEIDEEERERIRVLNKENRLKQEALKREKMLAQAKKSFENAKIRQENTAASSTSNDAGATLLNEQNGNQPFSCQPCRKTYQSDAQFQQHLNSAKHIKTVKDLEKKKK